MELSDQVKNDIETLLTVAKPKLREAYRNADAKLYHKVSEEFISVASRVFMHLYEDSDIAWFAARAFGSSLCSPYFWRYTDLVHNFCNFLDLRNKEVTNARATRT